MALGFIPLGGGGSNVKEEYNPQTEQLVVTTLKELGTGPVSNINGYEVKDAQARQDNEQLRTDLTNQQNKLNEVESKADANASTIAALNNEVAALKTKDQTLEEEVNKKANESDVQASIKGINDSLATKASTEYVTGQVEAINANLGTKASTEYVNTLVGDINSLLEEVNTLLDAVNGEVV